MAGRINSDDIAALRERADIAMVVGDYTSLKRAGTKLKGLCPFHSEKTPSFTVDAARNLYHCFGCGEGGDVYGFLQRAESLTFPEAVERLARIAGYELRYAELSPGQRRALGRRTRLTQALAAAAVFYRGRLHGEAGEAAREYLQHRGLERSAAEHFGLGWAPDQWDALVGHLTAEGFEPDEVADAGLATRGTRGLIDRFRGRLMFPIFDASGADVVAFGGRVLPGAPLSTGPREGQPPKYINSAESAVYKKSQTLYGLNWARSDISRSESAVVVEGYFDVIGFHLAGVRNVVATCGTALTADHFRALERFAPRMILALDADDAGFAAADRARALAAEVGVREVVVLPLPPGKDPADIAAEGGAAVSAALRQVKTAVEFQIEHLLRNAAVETPEGQIDAYRRTFPLLASVGDRVLRYTYLRDTVAPAVRVSADRIEAELDDHLGRNGAGGAETAAPARPSPGRPGDLASVSRDPQLALERDVLRCALQTPHLLPDEWQLVSAEDFRAPLSQALFRAIVEAPAGDLAGVLDGLADDQMRGRVRALALSDPHTEPDVAHVTELVARLRAAAVGRERETVRAELARVGEQLDPAEQRRLAGRLYELELRRRELLERADA